MTPTIVYGRSDRVIVEPTTDGLPPKRRVQSPWPRMAVSATPVRFSFSSNARPISGLMRSSLKYAGWTSSPVHALGLVAAAHDACRSPSS